MNFRLSLVYALCACFIKLCAGITQNYCSTTLCSSGDHIACNNNGQFASTCPPDATMLDITKDKTIIVDLHNKLRNKIAIGKLAGFKPAVRMATMVWDPELASVAALNVKQCVMQHDSCRNTDTFLYSGQNLAYYAGTAAPNATAVLINGINSWYNENKDANMTYINKCQSSPKTVGHFTVMVADRNFKLGCARCRYTKNGWITYLLACNYATTNMYDFPIYKAGITASKCTTGKHIKYRGLCSVKEKYNVNQWY